MSHRFAALTMVLAAVLLTAATAAIWIGITDAMVAMAGPKRYVAAAELPRSARGWFQVDGCIRHDRAVVVSADGVVYRLGEPGPAPDDGDRVYTPIADRSDCDDERPPTRIFALLEDAEGTGTTLGRAAPRMIAPPSIPATADGTIGPRVGDRTRANRARKKMDALPGVLDAPILHKGGRPAELWVALFTGGAGLHGLLLFALGYRYIRRRAARREALRTGELDDAEEQFFRTETLD